MSITVSISVTEMGNQGPEVPLLPAFAAEPSELHTSPTQKIHHVYAYTHHTYMFLIYYNILYVQMI